LRKAIGPGVEIDYQKEPRFARIYPGRPMKRYKPFEWLLGGEAAIHRLVTFLEHARDGLQAERQIVSFIGPVSAGKSKVATTCLELFAGQYVWILGYKNE
jgi:serine protein kinase